MTDTVHSSKQQKVIMYGMDAVNIRILQSDELIVLASNF